MLSHLTLQRGPIRIQEDFRMLICMSNKPSSTSHTFTSCCKLQTEGILLFLLFRPVIFVFMYFLCFFFDFESFIKTCFDNVINYVLIKYVLFYFLFNSLYMS